MKKLLSSVLLSGFIVSNGKKYLTQHFGSRGYASPFNWYRSIIINSLFFTATMLAVIVETTIRKK